MMHHSSSASTTGGITVNTVLGQPQTSTYPPYAACAVNRLVLRQAVAAVCTTHGFDTIQASTLETLTHLMNSYMNALCENSKLNCEVAGRNILIAGDVWLGLINMGHKVAELPDYLIKLQHTGSVVIAPPKNNATASNVAPLRVGRSRSHPAYVNEFLPPFPDPHTYIRTEISGEPDTSYEKVREIAATRKRDNENSLIDYMLRVHPRTSLFRDYEERMIQEARNALADRKKQKEARKEARRQAKAKERMQEIKKEIDISLDDMLDNGEPEQDTIMSSDDEDRFELEETETSLVLKRLPTYCSVLNPSLEARPYLTALVSEETAEEETQEDKNRESVQNANTTGDEPAYDNPFLRPPRMPHKQDFMEF